MNRRRASLLVLLTALVGAAPATRPTTAPVVDFVSRADRFHLQYPANWIIPAGPLHGQLFCVRTPPFADGSFGEAGLRVDSTDTGLSDGETLRELSGTIVGIVAQNGGQNVRITRGDLAGYPARTVRFHREKIAAMYVMTVHDHVQYVFQITAPADRFEALLPEVQAMLRSFELIE